MTTINTTHDILSGQTESGDIVVSGGVLNVDFGGTDLAAAVSSGGILVVSSGGLDSGSTISSGGTMEFVGAAPADDQHDFISPERP